MNVEESKKIWEKSFEKKMTWDEYVMFNWGYTYAVNDCLKESQE